VPAASETLLLNAIKFHKALVDSQSIHDFLSVIWIDPNGKPFNGTRDTVIEDLKSSINED